MLRPYLQGQPPGVLTFCVFLSLSASRILLYAVFFYGRAWEVWKRQGHPSGWSALCHGFSLCPAFPGPRFLAGLWRRVQRLSSLLVLSADAPWGPFLATRMIPATPAHGCEECTSWAVFWVSALLYPTGDGRFSCHCASGKEGLETFLQRLSSLTTHLPSMDWCCFLEKQLCLVPHSCWVGAAA